MDLAKRLRGALRVVGRGVFPGVRLLPRILVARQLRAARGPRRVVNQEGSETLVFSLRGGWVAHSVLEHTLGLALARRGERVRMVSCQRAPLECGFYNHRYGARRPCTVCTIASRALADAVGLPSSALVDDVGRGVRADAERLTRGLMLPACREFAWEGLALGRLVEPSVLWFFNRGSLSDAHLPYYRSALRSAVLFAAAVRSLLERQRATTRLFLVNGIFWPERVAWEVARSLGMSDVVMYERGFMTGTWVFSRDQAPAYYDLCAQWPSIREHRLTAPQARELHDYLRSRETFSRDAVSYAGRWAADGAEQAALMQRVRSRPTVVAFANITWDSAVVGRDLGFRGMLDWVRSLVAYAANHPQHFVVLRGHPAEIALEGSETTETVGEFLLEAVRQTPENFVYVGPESAVHSYRLMDHASVGALYGSTVGLEMVLRGRPVVVSGQAHYGDLGFTDLAGDEAALWRALERLCDEPLPGLEVARRRELAERYAWVFFFRQMVPLPWLREATIGHPAVDPLSLEQELAENSSPTNQVLDFIAHGPSGQFLVRRQGVGETP